MILELCSSSEEINELECFVNLLPDGPTSPFPFSCTYLCGEFLVLLLPHVRLAAEQVDIGASRQEALEEMSSSSINTNDLTDVKRSETEEMNQTHNHYISLSTSKTLMGPDIISPKVREDPISLIDT